MFFKKSYSQYPAAASGSNAADVLFNTDQPITASQASVNITTELFVSVVKSSVPHDTQKGLIWNKEAGK